MLPEVWFYNICEQAFLWSFKHLVVSAGWQISWELCFLAYLEIYPGEIWHKRLNVWQKWDRMEQSCEGLVWKTEAPCDLLHMFTIMLGEKKKGKKEKRKIQLVVALSFCISLSGSRFQSMLYQNCNFFILQMGTLLSCTEPFSEQRRANSLY